MINNNEDRLDYFADMLEPIAEIYADDVVSGLLKSGKTRLEGVAAAIRGHKQAVVKILAAVEETNAESYVVPGPIGMVGKMVMIFNSPEITELFTGQPQRKDAAVFGAATESTEGGAN